ncbi:endonuclease VII domain-containing protein [Streptomyces sp. NPDC055243]|uniref:endonuclease VII domain-containing protein n=1 Tax=Streptomyces sp. NPDC055243 TaxID=3365720 RepID=UPI0037CF0513
MKSDGSQRCSRRRQTREHAAFASDKSMPDGLRAYCRECSAKYYRQRQEAKGKSSAADGLASRCKACKAAAGPEGHLRREYGISVAERDELIAAQKGVCCICLAAPAVHVDHCHETGKVRGVLCFNCNAGLGLLRENTDAMHRAAAYLEGNPWKPTLVAPGVYQLPS